MANFSLYPIFTAGPNFTFIFYIREAERACPDFVVFFGVYVCVCVCLCMYDACPYVGGADHKMMLAVLFSPFLSWDKIFC